MAPQPRKPADTAAPTIVFIVLEVAWDVHRAGALLRSDDGLRKQLDEKGVAYREATEIERSMAGR